MPGIFGIHTVESRIRAVSFKIMVSLLSYFFDKNNPQIAELLHLRQMQFVIAGRQP